MRFVVPLIELMTGMVTTLKMLATEKPVTIQYPEEKRPVKPRFRGRHVLKRYDNGLEKCIGCALCAAACPADAIFIERAENTDSQRYSPGDRYASTYEINMLRCIYCGWDRWRRRTLGSTRPDEARVDAGEARASVRLDIWMISVARFAAAMTAIGAFIVTGLASAAAGVMVVALLAAPSRWQRLKHAFWQPLGHATLVLALVLALAMLWSPLALKPVLRDWIGLAASALAVQRTGIVRNPIVQGPVRGTVHCCGHGHGLRVARGMVARGEHP